MFYIVAQFDPPGNRHCQFKYNVLPEKGTELYRKLTTEPQVPDPSCDNNSTYPVPFRGCHKSFVSGLLSELNRLRAKHGAPPVVSSSKLAAYSQEWTDHLTEVSGTEYRPNNKYGRELIFKAW